MANDVGRPTILDDKEKASKIRELVLEGVTHKDIQEIMEIPRSTWDTWINENYRGFADTMLSYKHERILNKAEANIEQSMSSEDERVRVDVSKFALERLNKKNYSARVENTGADGQPLQIIVPKEVAESFNIHATTQQTEGSNTQ